MNSSRRLWETTLEKRRGARAFARDTSLLLCLVVRDDQGIEAV
jgi:hypothetical protein